MVKRKFFPNLQAVSSLSPVFLRIFFRTTCSLLLFVTFIFALSLGATAYAAPCPAGGPEREYDIHGNTICEPNNDSYNPSNEEIVYLKGTEESYMLHTPLTGGFISKGTAYEFFGTKTDMPVGTQFVTNNGTVIELTKIGGWGGQNTYTTVERSTDAPSPPIIDKTPSTLENCKATCTQNGYSCQQQGAMGVNYVCKGTTLSALEKCEQTCTQAGFKCQQQGVTGIYNCKKDEPSALETCKANCTQDGWECMVQSNLVDYKCVNTDLHSCGEICPEGTSCRMGTGMKYQCLKDTTASPTVPAAQPDVEELPAEAYIPSAELPVPEEEVVNDPVPVVEEQVEEEATLFTPEEPEQDDAKPVKKEFSDEQKNPYCKALDCLAGIYNEKLGAGAQTDTCAAFVDEYFCADTSGTVHTKENSVNCRCKVVPNTRLLPTNDDLKCDPRIRMYTTQCVPDMFATSLVREMWAAECRGSNSQVNQKIYNPVKANFNDAACGPANYDYGATSLNTKDYCIQYCRQRQENYLPCQAEPTPNDRYLCAPVGSGSGSSGGGTVSTYHPEAQELDTDASEQPWYVQTP